MDEDIRSLWQTHRQAALPDVPRESMGQLWVLDEVIGGCVTFYFEAGETLDASRKAILEDCRADLARLLPELEDTAVAYFSRLEALAGMLIRACEEGKGKNGAGAG